MVINNVTRPEKYEIFSKNGQFGKIAIICTLPILAALFSFLSNHPIIGLLLISCAVILLIIILRKEKNTPQLIIDNQGINYQNLLFLEWNNIQNIEIKTHYDSDGIMLHHIIIEDSTTKNLEISLDDLNIEITEIERIIRKFRLENKNNQHQFIKGN